MTLMIQVQKWYSPHLACPECRAPLDIGDVIRCQSCDYHAVYGSHSEVDLRPRPEMSFSAPLKGRLDTDFPSLLEGIETSRPPERYEGPVALRDSRELLSEIISRVLEPGAVLDLGCGPRDQAAPIEYLGHHYVGIDYSNLEADFLADAHAIPFRSQTFDCVLSYAVLEHLHTPALALREIERVLKPGGVLVGTVSQGEPFHSSFFHMTAWGVLALAKQAGTFEVLRCWPSHDTLRALATMGRYPRVIKRLIAAVDRLHRSLPLLAPRRLRWSDKEKQLDELYRAASICYVMKKLPRRIVSDG